MSLTAGKKYAVEFKVSVFAYVEFDDDDNATVTRVVADDENIGQAVGVEYDDASAVDNQAERDAVYEAERDLEWPAWDHGW